MALLCAALALRLLLAPVLGFASDTQYYVNWGGSFLRFHWDVYARDPTVVYPPLTVYLFALMDFLAVHGAYLFGHSGNLSAITGSSPLVAFMRLPFIAADLATIGLIYTVARRVVSQRSALPAAGIYAFLPAILLDGTLWAQTDGIVTLGLLVAVVFALRRQGAWAGVAIALTMLIKPQPIIYLPLILLYLWRWFGWRAAARCVVGALVAAVIVCLPFLLPPQPQILDFAHNLLAFLRHEGSASFSAYNLWWLLGVQHVGAFLPYFGPLSISLVGDLLFALALAVGALGIMRSKSPYVFFAACGLAALASFDVMVAQHERYIHPAIALFLLAGLTQRKYLAAFAVLSCTMFLNVALIIIWNAGYTHSTFDVTRLARFYNSHPQLGISIAAIDVATLIFVVTTYLRDVGMREHRTLAREPYPPGGVRSVAAALAKLPQAGTPEPARNRMQ